VTTTTGQEAGPPRSPGSGDVSATAPARPGLISAGAPAPPSGMLRTGPAGTGLTGAGMLRSGGGANQQQRRRIGEVLVEQGVIDEVQLQDLLGEQARFGDPKKRPRLGRLVVDKGLATERQVAQALATALGLPLIDIGRSQVPTDVARLIPKAVCERHGVLVIAREGTLLTVAMSDPTNIVALDDIRLYTRTTDISVVVAADSDLRQQIGRMWSRTEDSEEIVSSLEYEAVVDDSDLENGADGEQAPIVRLVDVMLADAVHQRASDVHVEPQYGEVRVRFRVDGLLRDVMTVPKSAAPAIISRLKIISGLDIAERRRPQDGRARLVIDGQALDARVSTLPSLYGEKVVIRLLARAGDLKSLKDIGMEDEQLEELLLALNQPQGLILITGPTGSGKTSTLYAGINQIRTPDRNIVTLEDPVEIAVPGVIQVQINVKAGMTFSAGLRSVLRQDPDVVLVGEIRDRETAGLALEASMTGHLVLSTLHTNDAIAAVTRLIDIGVEPYLVGSSLSLVIGQRLVRRPCEDCAQSYVPSPRTMQLLGLTERDMEEGTPRRGKGCGRCGGTGYLGRVGVYEVLPITASLREVLLAHPEERALAAAARAAGYVNARGDQPVHRLRPAAGRRHGLLPAVRHRSRSRPVPLLRQGSRRRLAGLPVLPHREARPRLRRPRRPPPGRGRARHAAAHPRGGRGPVGARLPADRADRPLPGRRRGQRRRGAPDAGPCRVRRGRARPRAPRPAGRGDGSAAAGGPAHRDRPAAAVHRARRREDRDGGAHGRGRRLAHQAGRPRGADPTPARAGRRHALTVRAG